MKKFFTRATLVVVGLVLGALVLAVCFRAASHAPFLNHQLSSSGTPVEITLSAVIDGSDRFVFSGESLWNEHLAWQAPRNVRFDGQPWTDLTVAPPGWPDRARQLDLPKAAIAERKGRDMIALETTSDGFIIIMADTPMGSATYEVTIRIPRK